MATLADELKQKVTAAWKTWLKTITTGDPAIDDIHAATVELTKDVHAYGFARGWEEALKDQAGEEEADHTDHADY